MQPEKFTQKSQEALQAAQRIARDRSHQEIDGEHLALALIEQTESLIPDLLERIGVPPARLNGRPLYDPFIDLWAPPRAGLYEIGEMTISATAYFVVGTHGTDWTPNTGSGGADIVGTATSAVGDPASNMVKRTLKAKWNCCGKTRMTKLTIN